MAEGGDFARADAGPLRARILAGLFTLLAALLLAALIILVQRSTEERDAAQARRQHSFNVILLTGEVDGAMARAEAALGRAIINTDREKGTLFYDEWQTAGTKLSRLRSLMRDDPPQLARLDALQALYDKRGDELRDAATRLNYKQNSAALSIFGHAGRSDDVLDIALLLRQIIDSERVLLDERDSQALASSYRSNLMTKMMSAVGAVLMLSAIAAGWMLVTALNERRIANEETLAELDRAMALERAVAQRTEELSTANRRLLAEAATREEAEAKLRQVQKMEAVGQLTGGIAHDFNNMLAVVIGALDLMERRIGQGRTDIERYLVAARDGASRAAALTQRLLAFSRRQPLAPTALDVNDMLTGMIELLVRTLGEGVVIETRFARRLEAVVADRNQLENVVLNLAVNSRDAMPQGGTLTIETEQRVLEPAEAEHHEIATGDYVEIRIRDTGTGMPPEIVARAFDPFFTTKGVGKGTGLGLSQVFGFVRQSGGYVAIDSEPSRGTCVRVLLPARPEAVPSPAAAAAATAADLPRGRASEVILVVEDEDRVRTYSVEALRELGYGVVFARDGIEALRLLERGQKIALLFSDVVMPEMSGRELAARVRQRIPDMKVLLTSGYAPDAPAEEADDNILTKPFDIASLAVAIRAALDG